MKQYAGMNAYIGTKLINAKPITRAEYNAFRGWELPANENGEDDGFLVEYVGDNQKPNTSEFEGYVSWSPKDVFEGAYKPLTSLDFGGALVMLKDGEKVARAGWNGKGMWIARQVPNSDMSVPYLYMKTADGQFVPWLASQTDILAEDWGIVV